MVPLGLNAELERLELEVQQFQKHCTALHTYQASYVAVCQGWMKMAAAGAAQPQLGDSLDRSLLASSKLPPL